MSKQPDGKAVWLLVHAKISIVAVFPQLQIEELKLQITEANAELTQNTERAKKAGADAKQLERYSATLTQTIEQAETSLSEIKDFSQYLNAAEKCRDLLQRIFDALTEHFNRPGILRDKKAEQTLLEKIESGFKRFFEELRNLIGFEFIANIPPEKCESAKLVEEASKLSLTDQIRSAQSKTSYSDDKTYQTYSR